MYTPQRRRELRWFQDPSLSPLFSRACQARHRAWSFSNHKTWRVFILRDLAIRIIPACINKTNMRQKKLTSMVKTTNLRYWRVQGIALTQLRPTNLMRVLNAYQRAISQALRILETLSPLGWWCNDLRRTLISQTLIMTFKTIFILHSNRIWWVRKTAHLKSKNNRTNQHQRSSQLAKSASKWKGRSST